MSQQFNRADMVSNAKYLNAQLDAVTACIKEIQRLEGMYRRTAEGNRSFREQIRQQLAWLDAAGVMATGDNDE